MIAPDPRAGALHAFDDFAEEFIRDCAGPGAAARRQAKTDVDRLTALAARLAADLNGWSLAIAGLDFAKAAPLAPTVAGRLVLESVFDEVLRPPATRLLSAALDLTWSRA